MRSLALFLGFALLASFAAVPALADAPDLKPYGACVGYDMCGPLDGDAIVCVKVKSRWVCGQCEACGNEPWLP